MSKFESILSDAEIVDIVIGLAWSSADTLGFGKEVAEHIQQAVLARLHEQEPLAWYVNNDITFDQQTADSWKKNLFIVKPLYENPSPSIVSDKTACVSESGEIDTQIKERHRSTKNHIPNAGKMVAPHGYRLVSLADIDTAIQRASVFDDGGDGADPESARSCIEILKSMISSKAIDYLEPKKEVVHDRHTGRELLYIPPVGESLYSMAQARKKSFSLALSVDTKEVQALLQSYLDSLEGWQLVPKEPTEEMHHAARDWSVEKYGKAIGFESSRGCYQAMLAAAPKHKGSNDD